MSRHVIHKTEIHEVDNQSTTITINEKVISYIKVFSQLQNYKQKEGSDDVTEAINLLRVTSVLMKNFHCKEPIK